MRRSPGPAEAATIIIDQAGLPGTALPPTAGQGQHRSAVRLWPSEDAGGKFTCSHHEPVNPGGRRSRLGGKHLSRRDGAFNY